MESKHEKSNLKTMKKILLAGSMNPYNKGDQARIKATIKKLTENKDITLSLFSHFFKDDCNVYSKDNIEIVKAPWSGDEINLVRMASITFFTLIKFILLSLVRHLNIKKQNSGLFAYDVVVIASGIDFSDFAGRLPLYYAFFLITLFNIVMKKPVICYAQSMGPIQHPLLRKLTRFFLDRTSIITVRDHSSLEFLHEMKVSQPLIFQTADPAFLLQMDDGNKQDILQRYDLRENCHPLIGISLSSSPFASVANGYCSMGIWYKIHKDKAERLYFDYIKKMAHICDRIVNKYYAKLVFIPNCTAKGDDDRKCLNNVRDLMFYRDRTVCINEDLTLMENMRIIGACDLFISTRLHASLAAAIMGVPFVTLIGTDSPRIPGILSSLGLDNYVQNIVKSHEDNVMQMVKQIWNIQKPMKALIQSRTRDMREKAQENITIFREFSNLKNNTYTGIHKITSC